MTTIPLETPINYEALARAFIEGIQGLHDTTNQQMGGLLFVGPTARRRLVATATIPDKLIEAMAATLEGQPVLASLSPRSAAKMREVIPFTAALTTVVERLELLARNYRETIAVRRSDVGQDVFRMYNVAKSMNRESDLAQFFPEVEALRQAFAPRARKSVAAQKAKAAAKAAAKAPLDAVTASSAMWPAEAPKGAK